jgi:ubiquinone/menaquinone biosynthesis C-methylase UbiE
LPKDVPPFGGIFPSRRDKNERDKKMNMKNKASDIAKLSYVELMAFLGEVNRPPGGKNSVRLMVQNAFLDKESQVLDVGCNTGYCTFEVAHLAKCRVTGIDISPAMISKAKEFQKEDMYGRLARFKVADGKRLPFRSGTFDLVFSGGSTAFMDDKMKALSEYRRVAKDWGFVADINFFYGRKPPASLLSKLNRLMGTDIKPWGIDFWLDLYSRCGLEKFFIFSEPVRQVADKEVVRYCAEMVKHLPLQPSAKSELNKRLIKIMGLFNENNHYLSYGVFVCRKRKTVEQTTLFGE